MLCIRPNLWGAILIIAVGVFAICLDVTKTGQARRFGAELRRSGFTEIHIEREGNFKRFDNCEASARFDAIDQTGLRVGGYLVEDGRGNVDVRVDEFGFDAVAGLCGSDLESDAGAEFGE